MSDESSRKGSAQSLIGSILKKSSAPQDTAQPAQDEPPTDAVMAKPLEPTPEETQVANLIEVYFELEEPEERDALFDQITAIDSALTEEFLETMLQEDNDYFVRSAAAAKLAGRGNPEAVALLERDLHDPQELFFFAQASQILGVIIGPSFYKTLEPIWNDEEQSPEIRHEALLGMETANPEATCRLVLDFLNRIESVQDFPEQKIELMTLIFARNNFLEGAEALKRLVLLVQKSNLDFYEKEEHLGLLKEALEVLLPPEEGLK